MSAIISHDGLYRYQLGRNIEDNALIGGTVAFFGVNPSDADAERNDPTIRKMMGFTKRHGFEIMLVGNVFAYRHKDVNVLATVADPVGPRNDQHLTEIIARADLLVPCWGAKGKVPKTLRPRFQIVLGMLRASGKPVKCLGFTQCGSPCHPQMLAYATPLVDWTT
jgi:hypothetical protein